MKIGIGNWARPFASALRVLALTLVVCATGQVWAATDKENPVTGETETYTYSFTGSESAVWNVEGNWSPSAKPYINGVDNYNAALVDGDNISIAGRKTITEGTTIEGWVLRVGLYNGAQVTFSSLNKMQGTSDMWITVDDSSKLTITSWGGGYIGDTSSGNPPRQMDYSVASENGITFSGNFSSTTLDCGMTYNYYLKGQGSVSYQALGIGSHKIKKADVTLSKSAEDTRTVERKKLVSFTSCTKTFTADATITVGGTVTDTKTLTTVTQNATTLTAAQAPGTCELVQISSGEDAGLWLYYVENGVSPIAIWTPQQYGVLGVIGTISEQSYWSTGKVPTDNADVALALSQDSDLYIDAEKTLGNIYVFSTSSDPITLRIVYQLGTLSATKVFVPANITVEVKTTAFAVPVQLFAGATLNLNFSGTWANAITGSGSVKVSDAITFSTANTFTGGLTVVSGGHAKTTNSTGYGPSGSTNITVQDGGALDIAGTNGSNYGASIEGEGVLVDSVRTGALYSSANCGDDAAQWYAITLNGNATIKCNENYNWGLLARGYDTTAINLGSYTLTKAGGGDFWLSYATISGSGTLSVSDGKLKPIARPCTGSDATIEIGPSGQLKISANSGNYQDGTLTIKNISCASGGSGNRIEVDSGKTLTVSNAMTVNGSASVAGALAGAGTATVTSTGTMSLTGACTISSLKVDRSGSITVKDGIAKIPTAVGANDQVKGVAGTGDTTYAVIKVAKTSDETEYYTIAEALAAINESSGSLSDSITIIADTTESFVIPRTGFALDTDGNTTGAISGASGVGVTVDGNVYTGGSNTAASWTGAGGDDLWTNPQNWSTKSVPTSSTTVTFNETVEVGMPYDSACALGVVVAEGKTLTLYKENAKNAGWATLTVGTGCLQGEGGKVKLMGAGIKKAQSAFTIDTDIEFAGTSYYDSFLDEAIGGTFTINGKVTISSGKATIKTSADYNSDVVMAANTILSGAWTSRFYKDFTVGDNSTVTFSNAGQTFNGTVTLGAGSTLTPTSGTCPTFGNDSLLIGSGRIVLQTTSVSDKIKTFLKDSENWTGTCELKGTSSSSYLELGPSISVDDYGNSESTVCLNGVSECWKMPADGGTTVASTVKCLEVGEYGLLLNRDQYSNRSYTIKSALKGSGTIHFQTKTGGKYVKHIFTGDVSGFTGSIDFGSLTGNRPAIIFMNEEEDIPTPTDYGQIIVTAGRAGDCAVKAAGSWYGAGGIIVNGTLNVASGGTLSCDSNGRMVQGSGTINYEVLPTVGDPSNTTIPYFSDSWTGTVILPATTITQKTGIPLIGLSSNNGRIVVKGITRSSNDLSIHLNSGTATIKGTLQLDGNLYITDGNGSATYTWNKVTGSGNMTVTKGAGSASGIVHAITTLDDYTGTLETKTFSLTIGTVNVSALDLTVDDPIVKLADGCNLTTDPANIAVKVGDVATSHKLFKASNGHLYIKVASVTVGETTTYYPTLQAAADAAMAAGGETITFTRIDSEAGTSLPGWTYEDGVFTRTGYAYNATTKTEYSTLAGAVAAASEGDTIQLMYGNSETAVDTTGKDFVFDENGYAFTGSWTGSGRIVLSTAPSTTTWSSGLFVSSGEGTTWTGTVTLDWEVIDYRDDSTTPKRGDIAGIVNKYGIAASTVEIGRNSRTEGNCYFNADTTPKLKVSGFLYINDGSSTTKRTVSSVCGNGVFVFGDKANTVNYGITNLDDWNGILTNKSAKVTVGTVTRGDGVIYCSNKPTTAPTFTDTEGNRWTGRFIVGWNQTTSTAFAVNSYGISGSTVEIPSDITIVGFAPNAANTTATIAPTIDVKGSLTFDNGYSGGVVNLSKVTGSGTINFNCIYTYNISTLEDWDGTITYAKSGSTASGTISNIVSGSGTISSDHAFTPSSIGNDWQGIFVINWNPRADDTQVLFSQYGVAGSTVAITGMTAGYLATQGNSEPLIQQNTIPATVRLDGNVKVTNGWQCNLPEEGSWPSATESNAGARQVIFSRLSGTGDFWCTYTGSSSNWGQSVNQHFVIQSLDGAYSGTLKIGKWFAVKLGAVDFAAEPAQNTKLIKVNVDTTEDASGTFRNSANRNVSQSGGLVDVTVNGVASNTKLFFNDTDGLYVAVASVTMSGVTTYYPTLAAAKTAAGSSSATITLLADVSEDITLAHGQVLDKGTTTYTGTVSAADSSAKIVEDGTTYKVRYGTIFSVW